MTRQEKLHDEKIIQQIFYKLNVNNFNENICKRNSWYGYKKSDIYQVIDFRDEAIEKCSSLVNNNLKAGLNITIEKLTDFLDFSASKMFLEKDEYVLIKDEIRYEQSEKDSVIINEKAQEAYDYVNEFIIFLNKIEINYKSNQVKNIKPKNKKIFIVHGRDTELKQSVYKILAGYGLEPIILEEQTNEGLTIIEKFEKNSDVGAAIVLLTPDDLGRLKTEKEDKHRARQNVIFELGYFIGKLGRNNVIYILDKKENIEIPTDISGLLHISVNDRLPENIKKELKQIRYDIV